MTPAPPSALHRPRPRLPGALAGLAWVLLVLGCEDPGAGRWSRARAAYQALVDQGEGPRAAGFDAVLEDLDAVPAGSAHAAEARRLAQAIRAGRQPALRTPLAMVPTPGTRPGDLEAALAECARLAGRLGQDGGVGPGGREALEACRRKAELLDIHFAHGSEHDGGGLQP